MDVEKAVIDSEEEMSRQDKGSNNVEARNVRRMKGDGTPAYFRVRVAMT
jgi:hypothetical protein